MGVYRKGATKYSQQRAILPMKLLDAGQWYVAWYGANITLGYQAQCATIEGNALLHLKLGLQRGLCQGDSLLYKGALGI